MESFEIRLASDDEEDYGGYDEDNDPDY